MHVKFFSVAKMIPEQRDVTSLSMDTEVVNNVLVLRTGDKGAMTGRQTRESFRS